jgi:CubicO group peptidase (beta-lactamase class C family)
VAADDVGGITAAVVQHGEVVWAQGFGWADRRRRVPAAPGTLYRTGSISKSFTAALAVLLEGRGVLDLDHPVSAVLPEAADFPGLPEGARRPTLRQLASHTSGLVREPRLEGAASGPLAGWEDKILASIPESPFETAPGARYQYSNIGFGVLGLAVSRAAGRPFMELVEREIFAPLGMTSSTFVVREDLAERLAAGHANGGDGPVDVDTPAREHAGRGYKVPNGGIYSTVGDLGRFMAAVSGSRGYDLFSAGAREALTTVHTPEDPRDGYGLGFFVRVREDGRRIVGHGGSVAGYTAYMVFEPESGAGVVLLRNYNQGRTNLGRSADALLEELLAGR